MENRPDGQRKTPTGIGARAAAWMQASSGALFIGACLALCAGELFEPGRFSRLLEVGMGALYGLLLRILVRAFPVSAAARPLAGLALGALPFALLLAPRFAREERLVTGAGLSLAGALIGVLEREEPPKPDS